LDERAAIQVIDLPIKERTLGRVVGEQASVRPELTFLNFKGEVAISFLELDQQANRYANGFLENGISKGTKVGVMLPNCPEYLYSWFGLAKIGAVMVPVNTAHKGHLLSYIINASDAEAFITDSTLLERVLDIQDSLGKLSQIFVKATQDVGQPAKIKITPLVALSEFPATPVYEEVNHSDPMSILFTSGTTGPSKGVVMSHHYYYYAAKAIGNGMRISSDDTLYTCLPLFHVNAQVCTVLSAMLFDARVAMYEHFSATTFWNEIRSSRATVFLALGAMGNILHKAPPCKEDADNNVRLAMVVPPPEDLEGFEKRFGLRVVYETFGMTEGIVTTPAIAEPRRPGCCGRPDEKTEVRIVDQDDLPLGPRQTGEIIIRPREPYTMMSGYYNMPEATVWAFRNLWFHTGDLGYFDEDGYLYFVGRKKEAIRRSGENISAF
jgi:crotonobetaine/carnitine-CoA ligase